MVRWQPDPEGRLVAAAITLFDKQGYDETTVVQIAEAAGLTKRTFFRYFTDKREVLFVGSHELQDVWVAGVEAAASGASAMAAIGAGLDAVAELFLDRHEFAAMRARIVGANPELQERELIKLQTLAAALKAALIGRGVPENTAILTAQAGVTVFHVAFAHWVAQRDPQAFRRLMDEALAELRSAIV